MITPLIYNEDIIAIKKKMGKKSLTPEEVYLLRHEGWNEHKVQSAARNIFNSFNKELESQNIGQVFFFQIDNGANGASVGAKVRKWQTGTVAKMPDTAILVYCMKTGRNKVWFCEFKKIGTKNELEGNPATKTGFKVYNHFQQQLNMHQRLRKMNFIVHLTNNTLYCEKVICEEIRHFLHL